MRSHIQDILGLIDKVLPEPVGQSEPNYEHIDRTRYPRLRRTSAPRKGPRGNTLTDLETYLGTKVDRPLANNTRVRRTDNMVEIVFHETVILTFLRIHHGMIVTIDSGGWTTDSTFRRINDYLPPGFTLLRSNRRKFNGRLLWTWMLMTPQGIIPFDDEMDFYADST